MGLTNKATRIRPILLTGKPGTGKSTKAKTLVSDNPVIIYASECDKIDVSSIERSRGIIIEDVTYKPKKDAILHIIRKYKGQVVITSKNQKDVPAPIKSTCQIKRAGSKKLLQQSIKKKAPRSIDPLDPNQDVFPMTMMYLKNSDRDEVAKMLLWNKPPDVQIITWLSENLHPNKLLFVDGVVKRRWPQKYLYEMLAYAHEGKMYGRPNMPKRGSYSKIPSICRRLGLKGDEERTLRQLLKDPEFKDWAKTKLDNSECRLLKIGEKRRKKKTDRIVRDSRLLDYW
tara:strand:+ start:4346 stop:5200 length:855 start_codon:yes stop_codon:yes gene_type:complete